MTAVSRMSNDSVLAIVCPQIGAPSETFIRTHIANLAPSRTVVLTGAILDKEWFLGPTKIVPIKLGHYCFDDDLDEEVLQFFRVHSVTHILCEFGCIGGSVIELNRRTLRLPVYVHFHGQDASQFLRDSNLVLYYRWIGEQVDGIIVVSQAMKARLDSIGLPSSKLKLIHYGINIPEAVSAVPETGPCKFITAARLVTKKGILHVLKAFKLALSAIPDMRLELIGEGPLRHEIEQYIGTHGLGASVRMLGQQPHRVVLDHLSTSNVYVQHSMTDPLTGDSEGLPVSILEASAYGLPVLSTFHEGIPEAVEHGITGFLVHEGDVAGMAVYMIELGKDCGLRKRLGSAGYEKMKRDGFSAENAIHELRKFIDLSCQVKDQYPDLDSPVENAIDTFCLSDVIAQKHTNGVFVRLDNGMHISRILRRLAVDACDDVTIMLEMNPKMMRIAGTSSHEIISHLHDKGRRLFAIDDIQSRFYPLDNELNVSMMESKYEK